ncbi:MAG: bis(5'-nucleosyl)-tetraphosphatase (symmetrical) YqeK [Clostridia bacterium]|nr:bis(5'-nucleosyl)-tetraphosphatase (symmetrical) YqeK [Clostridia bacterium]
MVSRDKIIEILKSTLSEKRLNHTMNVAECSRKLAKVYGADEERAYTAGLLHDITKEYTLEKQLKVCEKYGIILDAAFLESPQLVHPITGAALARELGADDEICRAVYNHTLGCVDMTILDKCVWLADLIEPSRNFSGVEEIRTLAYKDIDAAIIAAMTRTVNFLAKKGEIIHPRLIEARDALEAKR